MCITPVRICHMIKISKFQIWLQVEFYINCDMVSFIYIHIFLVNINLNGRNDIVIGGSYFSDGRVFFLDGKTHEQM